MTLFIFLMFNCNFLCVHLLAAWLNFGCFLCIKCEENGYSLLTRIHISASAEIDLNFFAFFFFYFFLFLIVEQLSGTPWWYKTASHATELTSGFYNSCNRDGYAAIVAMLKKHGVILNFTCAGMSLLNQNVDFSEALADPEGLTWQVSITVMPSTSNTRI